MGRLLLELAGKGYRAVGCEFSYQMLLLGDLMLNGAGTHALVPWAEEANNQVRGKQQLRSVIVPDVSASDVSAAAGLAGWELDMGMAAGEFVEAFGAPDQRGAFDAILMPFFLDTAVVPSEYLSTCANALKPGGLLVSLGPLQYHWNPGPPLRIGARAAADAEADVAAVPGGDRWIRSVELTWEEMLLTVRAAGFTVLEERRVPRLPYSHDPAGLRRHEYDGMLLIARLAPGTSLPASPDS
jgi:carnosine N-methyltransferase